MILVPENTLERLQQRQQRLTPPVTQALKTVKWATFYLASKWTMKQRRNSIIKCCSVSLTYYDQRKGRPLHVKLTTPKPMKTPKPKESSEETSKESTA